jgi:hypothetical protein
MQQYDINTPKVGTSGFLIQKIEKLSIMNHARSQVFGWAAAGERIFRGIREGSGWWYTFAETGVKTQGKEAHNKSL